MSEYEKAVLRAIRLTEIWGRVYTTAFVVMLIGFLVAYNDHSRWLWWFCWTLLPVGFYAYWRKEHYRRMVFRKMRSVSEHERLTTAWWLGLEKDK